MLYICRKNTVCKFSGMMRLRLFCSLAILNIRTDHTMDVISPFISVILTDSSTEGPVHVLMLSIQAVCGLPRLRAPGFVPCIISFSRQLPCFLMVWPQYGSFLALTVPNNETYMYNVYDTWAAALVAAATDSCSFRRCCCIVSSLCRSALSSANSSLWLWISLS